MTAALTGPLRQIRYNDGIARGYDLPRDTLDPRWQACAGHHPACDCREAELNEYAMEVRGDFKRITEMFNAVLGGHLTFAAELGDVTCECTGCRIARRLRYRYFESIELRQTQPPEKWIVMTDQDPRETPAKPEPPAPSGVTAETRAMATAHAAISKLDRDAQVRVIRWVDDRLASDNHARFRAAYTDEPPF